MGLDVIVHGVAIQPGKPVFVAGPKANDKSAGSSASAIDGGQGGGTGEDKLVIGLPGNPVSVLATAHLFVWPVVRRMLAMDAALPWRDVQLAQAMKAKLRRQLFRAVQIDRQDQAQPVTWHGSGDLMHTAHADGWVRQF